MKKKNKVLKITGIVVKIFVAVLIISFILTVVLQRFTNNKFSFFDYRMFSVLTGSMIPKYNVGDILISKEVDPEDIKVGDAITYLGDEGSFNDKFVTHDVIGIEEEEDGLYFRAKGVANEMEDPIVHEDQIYGVIIYKPWLLSTVNKIVSQPLGMYLFILLPIFGFVGYEIVTRMIEKEEARRSKK